MVEKSLQAWYIWELIVPLQSYTNIIHLLLFSRNKKNTI